ncbi:hypothetical protein GCM10009544_20010 [Streptomyces stramineus]|uniref:Uncharacterized protein n=1 Tax=Streptomyces stramineus TaxID=173861 RepID=A0ABN0ZSF0_9ACTN
MQPAKTVNRSPYAPLVTSPALSAQVVNLPSVVISTFRGAKVTPGRYVTDSVPLHCTAVDEPAWAGAVPGAAAPSRAAAATAAQRVHDLLTAMIGLLHSERYAVSGTR